MHREDEEVNLDDVCALFDDIEVGCYFVHAIYDCLSCSIKKFSNKLSRLEPNYKDRHVTIAARL